MRLFITNEIIYKTMFTIVPRSYVFNKHQFSSCLVLVPSVCITVFSSFCIMSCYSVKIYNNVYHYNHLQAYNSVALNTFHNAYSDGKESACSSGDLGLIPGLGRYPGEGNGNQLQYSCLENPMDGGAWRL